MSSLSLLYRYFICPYNKGAYLLLTLRRSTAKNISLTMCSDAENAIISNPLSGNLSQLKGDYILKR